MIKPGDRVRVVNSPFEKGMEGTVLFSKPRNPDPHLVLITKDHENGWLGKCVSYTPKNLELINPVVTTYHTAFDDFLFSL